jgi:Fic family protein
MQGRLLGRMERLGFALRAEAGLRAMTEEALRNAEIEGEALDREAVRSSIARRLNIPVGGLTPDDRRAEGMVEAMLDATQNYSDALTPERLKSWQAALFPTGQSGLHRIVTGDWRTDRDGPMQVVSGPIVRPKIHFEAPPAERIDAEIGAFLGWFNAPTAMDSIVHAAISHLWFVTIHPFEDGNGRIARILADMSLARSERSPQRFYSLSAQIRRQRADYYGSLEATQKGDLDITSRLLWFVACFSKAIELAEAECTKTLEKAEFWQHHALTPLTARQRLILNRFLDGFDGKLTARKWARIGKCSIPTAQRDIKDLVQRQILAPNEGGSKKTSYDIARSG